MSESKTPLVNQKPPDDGIPFGPDKNPEPTPSFRSRDVGQPANTAKGTSQAGILRREIYLAILQGFAMRGELSRRQPGTTIGVTTDADVQNICRHAAGVAAFAAAAAKESNL